MDLKVIKQCDRCGVKLVQWTNNDCRLLTNHAETLWDDPIYMSKRNSLLQIPDAFKTRVCDNLRDADNCALLDN